jgi:vacuolar-type H+-ATPase subunit E/Vma4
MAERDVAMAQARTEAHAINESAISGASLDARQVIVETLRTPTGADH